MTYIGPGTQRLFRAGMGDSITYLLNEEFTTNEVAPLVTPRTAEPGPGTLTILDAGNIISISGDQLVVNGTASGADSGFIQNDAAARVAGRAFSFFFGSIIANGLGRVGLNTGITSGMAYRLDIGTTTMSVVDSFLAYAVAFVSPQTLTIVERATGAFCIFGTTLVWVWNTSSVALKPAIWFAGGQSPNLRVASVKITDLATMDTDAEVYTSFSAAPASGYTAAMEANALIDCIWPPLAAETLTIMFRHTDDNNTLKLVCVQAAGTIKMYKTVAGVDTELTGGTTTQTWTAATPYRIVIVARGTTLITRVDGAVKNQPAAETTQQNAVLLKASGFTTLTNMYAWKTDLSAILPTELVAAPTLRFYLVIGDSKSVNNVWESTFESSINSASTRWGRVATLAQTGRSVHVANLSIDADLAALPAAPAPEFCCLNLGTNDVNGDTPNDVYDGDANQDGAEWTAKLQYIIDAVHTKWASCQVWIMRPWKPDYNGDVFQAKFTAIDGTYIPNAISGRAWAHLGPDERVFLENGDDGVTYIEDAPDRIHPKPAGYAFTAAQWKATLGL